jgi:glycosyltransferase involved in cell wall biosynthesis
MRVTFLLPTRSLRPAGGFKVVYEYANHLVGNGHEVTVLHPFACSLPASTGERWRARYWVARWGTRKPGIAPWFRFDPRVELRLITEPSAAHLPDSDVLVATAWHTAPWVAQAAPAKGAGLYLIQGYETWDGEDDTVLATWRLPLFKVVVSRWLEHIATELGAGESTARVPLGMDLERFGVDVPPAERAPRIGALYSSAPAKGSADVIAACERLREGNPELSAVLFGTAPRPEGLAAWIEYEQLPPAARLRELYNSCSVFLQASRSEGWGLPASEAMLCGCALVTLDSGGSREFAIDGETAVVLPVEQVERLAERTAALLADDDLRLRLAQRGGELLRSFTWERSVAGLEAVLHRVVEAEERR